MKVQLITDRKSLEEARVTVFPVFEGETGNDIKFVADYLKENPKFGKLYETEWLVMPNQSCLLVGLGKREKFNFQLCQNFAGTAIKFLLLRSKEATIIPPQVDSLTKDKIIYALVLGIQLADYNPSIKYKSENEPVKLINIQIYLDKAGGEEKIALRKAEVVSEAVNLARTWGDMPSNEMTPTYFVEQAKKIAKENGRGSVASKLKVTVINENAAVKMGMGGFTGVAKGSDEPSFMLVVEYTGDKRAKEKWGLVGKGLTFDSGGISIKPDNGMHEMKYDMSGAATVLATMEAISQLAPKINVVGVCAVTENMPSGKALKPGDIVKLYSGKTTEVLTTDAEGRMVLADALTYAQKDLKATKLIDLATLTGAVIVALGDYITGILGNNTDLGNELIDKGKSVGEKFWALPMDEEYEELLKSEMADFNNVGTGGSMRSAAGAIAGAKFLEKVVAENIPWVHLDIGGTAWDSKPKPYRRSGATGVGVKTLIELIVK